MKQIGLSKSLIDKTMLLVYRQNNVISNKLLKKYICAFKVKLHPKQNNKKRQKEYNSLI